MILRVYCKIIYDFYNLLNYLSNFVKYMQNIYSL